MPFEFEYALKLIKASRLFVQDRLLPTVVPAEKNVGMKNIYVLSQKIKGFLSQNLTSQDDRSRAMVPVFPRAVFRDILPYFVFSSGTTRLSKLEGRRNAPH